MPKVKVAEPPRITEDERKASLLRAHVFRYERQLITAGELLDRATMIVYGRPLEAALKAEVLDAGPSPRPSHS